MQNIREILQDNKFTKLVRPASFVSLLIIIVIFSIIDGNYFGISIKETYIKLFGELLQTMVIFYFTSRGLEKISQYINKDNDTNKNKDKYPDGDYGVGDTNDSKLNNNYSAYPIND